MMDFDPAAAAAKMQQSFVIGDQELPWTYADAWCCGWG